MENRLKSLNTTITDNKFTEMKNKFKLSKFNLIKHDLKRIMVKSMNISVSYNDNESKWMLIKNASGFSIGNNLYRRYNLQVLGDENGPIINYSVFKDPTDHHTLIPIIKNSKKQD
jgi:hypothetical protein